MRIGCVADSVCKKVEAGRCHETTESCVDNKQLTTSQRQSTLGWLVSVRTPAAHVSSVRCPIGGQNTTKL